MEQQGSKKWWDHPDRPCKGRTAEWFLENVSKADAATEVNRLVTLCGTCPVLEPCREDALTKQQGFGVQGGIATNVKVRYPRRRKKAVG